MEESITIINKAIKECPEKLVSESIKTYLSEINREDLIEKTLSDYHRFMVSGL